VSLWYDPCSSFFVISCGSVSFIVASVYLRRRSYVPIWMTNKRQCPSNPCDHFEFSMYLYFRFSFFNYMFRKFLFETSNSDNQMARRGSQLWYFICCYLKFMCNYIWKWKVRWLQEFSTGNWEFIHKDSQQEHDERKRRRIKIIYQLD
jgi:hypothetical protein